MAFEMKCYRRILATNNNECRDQTKAGHQKECDATDQGEETQNYLGISAGWMTT